MAHRKEVFQAKVLQRLYPLPRKPVKEPSPPHTLESVVKTQHVKQKACEGADIGDGGVIPVQPQPAGRRVYTALPPPEAYQTGAQGSVMLSQPTGVNTGDDPADESFHDSNEEQVEKGEVEGQKRRRKRRKKRKADASVPGRGTAEEEGTCGDPANRGVPHTGKTPAEGGEQISKNKRRKLKKKLHKEKLLSLGLVPRAAALEFTYQRKGDGDDEEDEEMKERRAADVLGFLRTTLDLFLSDCSSPVGSPCVSPVAVEGLLTSITSGTAPPSALTRLHTLKALVQQKDTGRLAKALEELQDSSTFTPEEATAVVSLFHYWITDILPMQRDMDTHQSTTQP